MIAIGIGPDRSSALACRRAWSLLRKPFDREPLAYRTKYSLREDISSSMCKWTLHIVGLGAL
jgi:hypothetical protein